MRGNGGNKTLRMQGGVKEVKDEIKKREGRTKRDRG